MARRVRRSVWLGVALLAALVVPTSPRAQVVPFPGGCPYVQSATAAASTGVTLTLPAAGPSVFHYLCAVEIRQYAAAALTGGATPVLVTTTNLGIGNPPTFTFATALAIGTAEVQPQGGFAAPMRSAVANTDTTIVAPATTNVIWRITVSYYQGG